MKKDTIAALWVILGLFFLFFSGHPPLYARDLATCGYHNLHIYFENVPADWPEYQRNNDHMYLWNQYMDIYRYGPGNSTWGHNGVNEFAGYPSDEDLDKTYGLHWPAEARGMCITSRHWWPPWDDGWDRRRLRPLSRTSQSAER